MSDITIVQAHAMSADAARAALQKVADEMAADFDVASNWEGDTLVFKRTGLSGTVALTDGSAQLDMTLGIMLKSFAPKIQEKLAGNMKKVFGVAGTA